MTGVVTRALCQLALRCLPAEQRSWGRAMCAELDHVASPRAALAFAAGCLRTGLVQRFGDGPTRYLSGRSIVIVIGLICAGFHLGCVVSGIAVLRGTQHDPVLLQLMTGVVAPDALDAYRDMRPLIVLLIASLGIAHIAVAWQVWRGGCAPSSRLGRSAPCWRSCSSAASSSSLDRLTGW